MRSRAPLRSEDMIEKGAKIGKGVHRYGKGSDGKRKGESESVNLGVYRKQRGR